MGLIVFIHYRVFRIISHARCSYFVNNKARVVQPVIALRSWFGSCWNSAQVVQDFFKSILHVLGLFYFMVAPGVMKPQYGNTVFIDCIGINFAIVIFPGYA